MRHSGTTYAANLNLAQDRAARDRQAADAWRRLQTQPDVDGDAEHGTTEIRGLRAALAHLFGALRLRRMRPTT